MAGKTVQRRLAAILAADVVGYSQLMSIDEVRTLDALKLTGASCLTGRLPPIMAVSSRLQATVRWSSLPASSMRSGAPSNAARHGQPQCERGRGPARIALPHRDQCRGTSLSTAMTSSGMASILLPAWRPCAEPGGVCISRAANDQIRDKLSFAFADLGEQTVKNISRAVGVFGLTSKEIKVLPEPELAQPVADQPTADTHRPEPRYGQEI